MLQRFQMKRICITGCNISCFDYKRVLTLMLSINLFLGFGFIFQRSDPIPQAYFNSATPPVLNYSELNKTYLIPNNSVQFNIATQMLESNEFKVTRRLSYKRRV